MTNARAPLVDGTARERAATDLATSFCVEAGAGTGKTTLLVERFISIVASGSARCDQIVAITFTEKAAGEMKTRLRHELSKRLEAPALGEAARRNLEAASIDLERAPISTIHSFAATILREHPIEAGIDPDFTQLDALEGSLFFDECWNDFLVRASGGWGETIRLFILFGGSIGKLRDMADEMYMRRGERACEGLFAGEVPGAGMEDRPAEGAGEKQTTARGDARAAAESSSLARLRARFTEAAGRLDALACGCCIDPDDRGRQAIVEFTERMRRIGMLEGDDLAYELLTLPLPKNKGNKQNWRPADACAEQKTLFGELADLQANELKRFADRLRGALEDLFEALLAFVEKRKIESGVLDFDDLLIKVRELCKDREALDRLRDRYRYILVDEFQDTDPVQAEIVFLLAGAPGDRDPSALEPGRLFIVGDPKQSIYRFRKADVEVYERVKERLSLRGERLAITQNFRSVPGIVGWVNDTFSGVMLPPEKGAFQPRYEPIHAFRPGHEGPSVVLFDLELDEDSPNAEAVRGREGEAIARLIRRLCESGASVMDTGTRGMRAVRYGDIAVLYPATTGIESYEEPLRVEGIPYIVEGGKLFYSREEIRDLASALWAIEDPCDSLALVGALRSPIFGFSDEELFLFKRAGGELDYLGRNAAPLAKFGDLAAAFELLAELHLKRNDRGPARTILELLRRTKYRELSLLRPHGEQRVSNIRKAVSTARTFEEKSYSYRRFARWFRDQESLDSPESESSIIEEGENAVRLITIHKAKGLQFPVVILANLIQKRRDSSRILVERGRRLSFKLGDFLETSDFAAQAEREKLREAAETVRLLYVAATRAGDLLVIPRVPKDGGLFDLIKRPLCEDDGCGERPDRGTRYGPVWKSSDLPQLRGRSRPFVRLEAPSTEERKRADEERARWLSARAGLLERARRAPLVLAPSKLASGRARPVRAGEAGLVPPMEKERAVAGRDRPLLFGLAFHRVMELADLSGARSPREIVSSVASELGLSDEAAELERCATSALASEIVGRAARADCCLREVPFVVQLDGDFVEGRIDLLFEEKGRWSVVDYKTDDPGAGSIEDRIVDYRVQAGIYVLALERLGMACAGEVSLYFVRPNVARTIECSPALREEARRAIRDATLTRENGRAPSTGPRRRA